MTHQGLIFARWIDYRVLATILKINRKDALDYCGKTSSGKNARGVYGCNLIPKLVSAQDGAAMDRKAREISHALDTIDPKLDQEYPCPACNNS